MLSLRSVFRLVSSRNFIQECKTFWVVVEHARSQELARLQGVGPNEWHRYNMPAVSDSLMRDLIGNAFLSSCILFISCQWIQWSLRDNWGL